VLGSMLGHARKFEIDETETKNLALLQRQMIQTEKLASLGQIVAGVVHELNNPLTSIIAYSDYLRKRAVVRAERGDEVSDDIERLGRIGEAAERILRFSRDLVAYARPSTDVPGPVSLPDVIDKAIVFCEHEFSKSSVVVQKRLEPNLPLVRGIAGQLTQVFVNLFTNAAHAMLGSGGALDIHAERADEETVIAQVADQGVGITTEDIEQIFEPFFTTKVEGVGTGLGLAIVRDIVTQHGGNLTAQRRVEGGTVFTLHLPVVALPSTLRPRQP
jgi:C4-dicarboxylate-specific signal transduction histidine kinase